MPITVVVTIIPAINTPEVMAMKAFLNFMPNRKAIAQPVQAPVMGSGMATKIANAIMPKFSWSRIYFFLVRVKSQKKKLSPTGYFLR